MKYGVVILSSIPVRKRPGEDSEMINQLLFGACFEVIGDLGNWLKIKTLHDDYEGWVDRIQAQAVDKPIKAVYFVTSETAIISTSSGTQTLLRGSRIPEDEQEDFFFGDYVFSFNTGVLEEQNEHPENLVRSYLNTPYLWGGRSPMGIDCSGFVQVVSSMLGVALPRDASQQINHGKAISFKDLEPMDLVYFKNEKGKISHVGFYLGDQKIIHAHGKVREDELKKEGIFNTDREEISHEWHDARRIDFGV